MDLRQVLDRLYQNEINFMIYALWDGGITVKLGFLTTRQTETLSELEP